MYNSPSFEKLTTDIYKNNKNYCKEMQIKLCVGYFATFCTDKWINS